MTATAGSEGMQSKGDDGRGTPLLLVMASKSLDPGDVARLMEAVRRTSGWEVDTSARLPSSPRVVARLTLKVPRDPAPIPDTKAFTRTADMLRNGNWRWADHDESLKLSQFAVAVADWLRSLDGTHRSTPDPSIGHLIEGLCGWIDHLLTRNLLLEQFLADAREASRGNAQLKAQITELEKDLEQARLMVDSLAVEPKKAALDPKTSHRATSALQTMAKATSTAVLAFIASAGGALAPTVYLADQSAHRAEARIAALEAEVREIHEGVDDRCLPILELTKDAAQEGPSS